jgi:hypothetical protein
MGIRKGGVIPLGVKCLRGFEEGNDFLKPLPQDRRINKLMLSPVKPFLKVPRMIGILGISVIRAGQRPKGEWQWMPVLVCSSG